MRPLASISLCFALLSLAACAEEQPPVAPVGAGAPYPQGQWAPQPAWPAAPPAVVALDTKAWTDRGMPSPDKRWAAAEYATALQVLQSVPPAQYPRLGDPASGVVFARFVAHDNLAPSADKNLSLLARMQAVNEVMKGSRDLLRPYIAAIQSGTPLRREALAFLVLVIDALDSELDNIEIGAQTIDPNGPKYEGSVTKLTTILDTAKVGVVDSLKVLALDGYAPDERREYCQAIMATLPGAVSRFPTANREEILALLRQEARSVTDAVLAASIAELARAVEIAPARPIEPPRK